MTFFCAADVSDLWLVAALEVFFDENSSSWGSLEWTAKKATLRNIRSLPDGKQCHLESSRKMLNGVKSRRDMWRSVFGRSD